MTLDGVMQAPGGPEEDPTESFEFGGWQAPYMGDDVMGDVNDEELKQPVEYLLGRKTFDIFADYWPKHAEFWPQINDNMKYVLSTTMKESGWKNTTFITGVEDIKKLKETDGPDLQVWGSSKLVHLLLENDLVDEMRIMTFPLILGKGKKMFADGAAPAALTLIDSKVGSSGAIVAWYKRAGDVKTGTIGV
ncbi:MAG: dihydrofolate reductase [Candidatus Saccharibacteria bacterium]|nr:dihydrofolate reductase [Candidatus Saccharibacteria bacterium]